MVQWLRLWASNAGDTGHGTKIPHATWQKIKIKKKIYLKQQRDFFEKRRTGFRLRAFYKESYLEFNNTFILIVILFKVTRSISFLQIYFLMRGESYIF